MADVGAGAGYHSIRLARRVGPKGTVLATDVQPEMLRMLRQNARDRRRRATSSPSAARSDDTKLPEGKVDLILMVDVYHECSDPEAVLQGLRKALKPGGRLVLVEFRGEDPDVPIKPEHKMTVEQVRREVEPQGFAFKELARIPPLAARHHLREAGGEGARSPARRRIRRRRKRRPIETGIAA